MKLQKLTLALTAATLITTQATLAEDWTGSTSLMFGQTELNNSDWTKNDDQDTFGVMTSFGPSHWPVLIAIDAIARADEYRSATEKSDLYTAAMHLGVRKELVPADFRIKPYIGGGLALVNVELQTKAEDGSKKTEEDSGFGSWIGTGVTYEVCDNLLVGLDVRYSDVEVKLDDRTRQAGGVQTAFTVGYSW